MKHFATWALLLLMSAACSSWEDSGQNAKDTFQEEARQEEVENTQNQFSTPGIPQTENQPF